METTPTAPTEIQNPVDFNLESLAQINLTPDKITEYTRKINSALLTDSETEEMKAVREVLSCFGDPAKIAEKTASLNSTLLAGNKSKDIKDNLAILKQLAEIDPVETEVHIFKNKESPSQKETAELRQIKKYWEKKDKEHKKNIQKLNKQIDQPLSSECRAIVCIPSRGEGNNIYRTLKQYTTQKNQRDRYINPKLFEIIIFDNIGSHSNFDHTKKEVERFKKEHPEFNVQYVRHQFPEKRSSMGKVRKIVNDLALLRILERNNSSNDTILLSHDADLPEMALSPTYFYDLLQVFDQRKEVDAVSGRRDFPEETLAKYPLLHLLLRFERYVQAQAEPVSTGVKKRPYLFGNNSAFRSSAYAEVGGYKEKWRIAEDIRIGSQIMRKKPGKNVVKAPFLWAQADTRRYLSRLERGKTISGAYGEFFSREELRGKSEDSFEIDKDSIKHPDPEDLEREVNRRVQTFSRAYGKKGIEYIQRALTWLNIDYEVSEDGEFKITNIDKALTDLKKYRSSVESFEGRTRAQRKDYRQVRKIIEIASGLKSVYAREIRSIGNTVYLIKLENGENLYAKVPRSTSSRLKKEAWCLKKLNQKNVNVPQLVLAQEAEGELSPFVSVQKEVEGTSYNESAFLKLPDSEKKSIHRHLGKVLASIHQVDVNGYGDIDESGKGKHSRWSDYLKNSVYRKRLKQHTQEGSLDRALLSQAYAYLDNVSPTIRISKPQLVHGDIWVKNLLIQNGKVNAVLDWENAVGGDGVYDLARYSVSQKEDFDMSQVFKGYGVKKNNSFWKRYHLYRIHACLYSMGRQRSLETIRIYERKLRKSVNELSKLIK